MENFKYSKLIKEYREIEGITQSQLAKILNVSDMTIARWESDKFEPSAEKKKELRTLFRERGMIKDIKFEPFTTNERMVEYMNTSVITSLHSVNDVDNYDRKRVNSVISFYINEYRDDLVEDRFKGAKKICLELLRNFGQKYYEYFKIAFLKMMDITDEEFDEKINIYDDGMYISCDGYLIRPADNFYERRATFPDYITEIGEKAFMGCPFIEEVVINKNIKKIHDGAFNYCNSLTDLVFDDIDKDLEIGNDCFKGCIKLKCIVVNDEEPLFFIKTESNIFEYGAALYRKQNEKLVPIFTLTIPKNGNLSNFYGIDNITEVKANNGYKLNISKDILKDFK